MYTNYDEKTGFLIAEDTLIMYSGQSESVTIPAAPERGHSIRLIGHGAFTDNTKLGEVVIPEGIREIGNSAFSGCTSLRRIVLPHTLRKIGEHTFSKCSELEEIVIPDGVQEIGNNAFCDCTSLRRIVLPHTLQKIGVVTFDNCSKLEEIVIPDSVQEIGFRAFYKCTSLKRIVLPKALREIYHESFSYCTALEKIEFPDGVWRIGGHAFLYCTSLKRIVLPKALQTIDTFAFSGCSALEEIEIPDAVRVVGSNAFDGCSALRRVVVPQTLHTLQKDAFAHCTALKQVNIALQFSNTQMDMLLNHSRESADGQLFVVDSKQYSQLHALASTFSGQRTATLPENIPILFQDGLNPAVRHTRSVFIARDCIRFDGKRGKISEDEAFRQLLESGKFGTESSEDEQRIDLYHRTEKAQPYSKVVIPSFDRNHIKQKDGYASLVFTLHTGWFFWQSAQKVVWKGKPYYIYRRHYLSGDSTRPFDRLDMAIYDKDGLVTNRKISEEVYAKYRLLSML